MNQTLVIIPIYNERRNLEYLIPAIFAELPKTDILIIDDHSQDGSADFIKDLQKENSNLFLIERPAKLGLGSAYITGFFWGLQKEYAYFFEMDGDGSHDPKFLKHFLAEIERSDIVLGSRYIANGGIKNWNMLRRAMSFFGNIYAKTLLGLPYHDLTGGFKCFHRDVLKKLPLDHVRSDGYCFQIELTYLAHQLGFRIHEIPIIFTERRAGKSKFSRKIVWEAFVKVPLLRIN